MRFFKFISIAVITLLIVLLITYTARISVISNFAKTQLSLVQVKITCLDFSLGSNMTVIVDKVCLQSPKADIEILDMAIQWQYSPEVEITDIDISSANIKGKEHFFSNVSNEPSNNNQNLSQLLISTLHSFAEQIKQFNLPVKINVAELSYLPFSIKDKSGITKKANQQLQGKAYTGMLSTVGNNLFLSLQNTEKVEFIKANLTQEKQGFSISLSSELNLLKKFISTHQLPITAQLQNNLNAIDIRGRLDSLIQYQANSLSIKNKIVDISIDSEKGINNSGAFKVSGALSINSQFDFKINGINNKGNHAEADKNDVVIALTFIKDNELTWEYSQSQLFSMLEENELPDKVISILKDNPLSHLTLKPQGSATLYLNEKKGYLESLELLAYGDEKTHYIKVDEVTFTLPNNGHNVGGKFAGMSKKYSNNRNSNIKGIHPKKSASSVLSIENFIIDSQFNLSSIAEFTTKPLVVHLEGSFNKTEEKSKIHFNESSFTTVNNITISDQKKSTAVNVTTKQNTTAVVKVKTLKTTIQGRVQLLEDSELSVHLKTHSQASQLNIPKVVKVTSFDLFSEIKGNFDDITINATANADDIKLADIAFSGSVLSPKIQISANELQLTDVLSLNLKLPTSIELIDGILNYNVSTQIDDFNNIENTPFSVSFVVTSVSGEIDGIWLQELNWQQHFTLLAGKISTQPSTKENLTVELIETPTPISKLSINTNWSFNKSFTFSANKLKADILGGSFSIPKIKWPFEHGHSVNVQLNSIDLEQVLALDKKQGIVVTGKISGQLPVSFDGEKYIIENGELFNISDGLIQVKDNPAVAELKANNTQLQLAFDALQNLHYHQLSSAVSMADDGYMLLETVIKGRNPDIDNDVNLNLNLSYDLLGLLESMTITQRFEENIIKGLQKNKE